MSRPKSDARERLLAAALDHVTTHGIGDLTLRQLAEALGTSHRMLIYHFGSKERLLVEVVRALERHYQEMVEEWIGEGRGVLTPAEELRRIWRFVIDPKRAPYAYDRLFYELYGRALQGRPHTTEFLEGNVESWLTALTEIFRSAGMPTKEARNEARLAVAVFRGLILDFLATGDRSAVNRAMERYLSQLEARQAAGDSQASNRPGASSRTSNASKRPRASRRAS